MANTTKRNTSPTCTKRSLNARLMSRLRSPSIPSNRMCPPSRIGTGTRSRIPRFTPTTPINEIIARAWNLWAGDGRDQIILLESRALRRYPRRHISQNGPNRHKAEQALRLFEILLLDRNIERAPHARLLHFHREFAVRRKLGESLLCLLPVRIPLSLEDNDLIARV